MSSDRPKSPRLVRKNLLDKLDLRKPVHTGYMFKQSHIPPKNFNKRFFALYPKVLVYYDTQGHFTKDVQTGSLAHRHKALLLDHLYLTKPEKKPPGAKFCFILHAPNAHNERHGLSVVSEGMPQKFSFILMELYEILLVTETREERRVWMNRLQEQNPDLLESDHHHHHHRGGSTSSTGSISSTGSSGSLLTVPQGRKLRADSITPESPSDLGTVSEEETQTITFHEGPSDDES